MAVRDLAYIIISSNGVQKKVIDTDPRIRPNFSYEQRNGSKNGNHTYITKEIIDLTYVRCLKVT